MLAEYMRAHISMFPSQYEMATSHMTFMPRIYDWKAKASHSMGKDDRRSSILDQEGMLSKGIPVEAPLQDQDSGYLWLAGLLEGEECGGRKTSNLGDHLTTL